MTLKGQSKVTHNLKAFSRKGAELGHMVLWNTNRKLYMGSQMAPWHMTLSALDMSKSVSISFRLISRKGAELGHMLLLHTNKKSYMVRPMAGVFSFSSDHIACLMQNGSCLIREVFVFFASLFLIMVFTYSIWPVWVRLIDWLNQSFTAHQHQKGHTVPKQVSPLDDDDDDITEYSRKNAMVLQSENCTV